MPQAPQRLRKMFKDDGVAWSFLEDTQNFGELKFMIYPFDAEYKMTDKECAAIDYLCQEWDWEYDPTYVNSTAVVEETKRKMKIVHAIWLVAHAFGDAKANTTRVINVTAKMLDMDPKYLFKGFNKDFMDRAWHSRPTTWKPQDSIA